MAASRPRPAPLVNSPTEPPPAAASTDRLPPPEPPSPAPAPSYSRAPRTNRAASSPVLALAKAQSTVLRYPAAAPFPDSRTPPAPGAPRARSPPKPAFRTASPTARASNLEHSTPSPDPARSPASGPFSAAPHSRTQWPTVSAPASPVRRFPPLPHARESDPDNEAGKSPSAMRRALPDRASAADV